MMGLPNIGLCGYMRSGKDTIADYLIDRHDYGRLGFADALKEEVARGVGCTPAELNKEPLRSQVRPVLQVWGTEFRRAQDSNYWVRQAERQIEAHMDVFVCDECHQKFPHRVRSHARYLGRGEGPDTCRGTLRKGIGPLVFNDVRFHNEIEMLRDWGFLVIKVDMSVEDVLTYTEAHGEPREVTLARLSHASEREWQEAEFDVVIPSVRGNIQGLYDATERVLEVADASA
jgi:hypothetical protein